jgi:hypothetical protein
MNYSKNLRADLKQENTHASITRKRASVINGFN